MVAAVAFVLYDGAALADLAGPLAVLSLSAGGRVTLHTVGRTKAPVTLEEGLEVMPEHTFPDAQVYRAIVVPGGRGWEETAANLRLLQWLARAGRSARLVVGVGTGVRLLAAAGLLDGREAAGAAEWAADYPAVRFVPEPTLASSGKFITTRTAEQGIALGIQIAGSL